MHILKNTDFSDTMFDEQVAHGYFIISAAAGLFVDSYEKNPVLLNYGIEELAFYQTGLSRNRNLY